MALALWAGFWPRSPGVSIGLLALVAGIMSVRPQMRPAEKAAWVFVLVAFAVLEVHAINRGDEENKTIRDGQNEVFKGIADGVKKSNSQLEISNRNIQVLSIGILSLLNTKAVQGAVASPAQPSQRQQGQRFVSAEKLDSALKSKESSAATVINDGTNEAGNFSDQLVIGLRCWLASWRKQYKDRRPELFSR